MRLTVDRGDPDYFLKKVPCGRVRAFLDGVEIDHVTMADSERGIIECYVTDADGKIVVRGDVAVTKTLRGNVTIEIEAMQGSNGG